MKDRRNNSIDINGLGNITGVPVPVAAANSSIAGTINNKENQQNTNTAMNMQASFANGGSVMAILTPVPGSSIGIRENKEEKLDWSKV